MKEEPPTRSGVMASLGGFLLFGIAVAVLTYGGLRLLEVLFPK